MLCWINSSQIGDVPQDCTDEKEKRAREKYSPKPAHTPKQGDARVATDLPLVPPPYNLAHLKP